MRGISLGLTVFFVAIYAGLIIGTAGVSIVKKSCFIISKKTICQPPCVMPRAFCLVTSLSKSVDSNACMASLFIRFQRCVLAHSRLFVVLLHGKTVNRQFVASDHVCDKTCRTPTARRALSPGARCFFRIEIGAIPFHHCAA